MYFVTSPCSPPYSKGDKGETEGATLFYARVLLAESDVTSAEKIKEMLEYAGYIVTVEENGKQVRREVK